MKNSIISFTLLMIIFSCSKDHRNMSHENTLVKGVLLNAADRSPINNGTIIILKSFDDGSGSAIWNGRNYKTRNTLLTNQNGEFTYSFRHSSDTIYALSAEADSYFANGNSGGFPYPNWYATGRTGIIKGFHNYFNQVNDEIIFENNKGVVKNPEIRLAPIGWINFQIENIPPVYTDDVMRFLPENQGGQSNSFNGPIGLTQFISNPIRAGRYSKILYNLTSQGNFKSFQDSIFVIPNDTVTYILKY